MMFTLKSLRRLVVGTAVALATTGLVLTVPLSAAGREGASGLHTALPELPATSVRSTRVAGATATGTTDSTTGG